LGWILGEAHPDWVEEGIGLAAAVATGDQPIKEATI